MKKQAIKKTLAFFLAVLMMLSVVGCVQPNNGTNPSSDGGSEGTPLYNVGSLPIVNEPVTIKILTQDPVNRPFSDARDAGIWEWLEEKTGINIEVESYPAEELKQKLPLIMASPDEAPDIFLNCGFKEADIMNYGQNGQILVLDDYIEQYGTNIKACFDELDYAYGASVSADGHIYSLPAFNGTKTVVSHSMNREFLERIDMEAPTTLEELYEVFKKIQASDANGNGDPNDEICLTGTPKSFKRVMLSIVGLNCYWPWEGALFDAKDDEVFFVETSEQYKYMLQWLHTFYKEGMMDNEFFTQTSDQLFAKKDADRCFMFDSYMDPFNTNVTGCEIYTPLTSAVNDTPLVTASAPYQVAIGAISAHTKYPEVCMLLLDYLFTEEASQVAYWGIEGVDYTVTDKENWVIECIGKNDGYGAHGYKTAMIMPYWNRDEWIQPAGSALAQKVQDVQGVHGEVAFQNYLHFTTDESEEISVLAADLGLYLDDHYVGFITGTYDIETEWDDYVAMCKQLGADRLTEIYQDAYNRYYGIDQ